MSRSFIPPQPSQRQSNRCSRDDPKWTFQREIGSGSFAKVFLEVVQPPLVPQRQLCAVKRISKDNPIFPKKLYMREIDIFSRVAQNEHFVQFITLHEDRLNVYIVMEYMKFGDLEKYINFPWDECDAKLVGYQLLSGLKFLHGEGITHRDLKPANIFPDLDRYGSLLIKIGDFGVSKRIPPDSDTFLRTNVGSTNYVAPEIIKQDGEYSPTVDCFSVGCVIYRLVTSTNLFETLWDIFKHSQSGDPSHELGLDEIGCSEDCISFVGGLLRVDPTDRLTAAAALEHPWVSLGLPHQITNKLRGRFHRVSVVGFDFLQNLPKMTQPYPFPKNQPTNTQHSPRTLLGPTPPHSNRARDTGIPPQELNTSPGPFRLRGMLTKVFITLQLLTSTISNASPTTDALLSTLPTIGVPVVAIDLSGIQYLFKTSLVRYSRLPHVRLQARRANQTDLQHPLTTYATDCDGKILIRRIKHFNLQDATNGIIFLRYPDPIGKTSANRQSKSVYNEWDVPLPGWSETYHGTPGDEYASYESKKLVEKKGLLITREVIRILGGRDGKAEVNLERGGSMLALEGGLLVSDGSCIAPRILERYFKYEGPVVGGDTGTDAE